MDDITKDETDDSILRRIQGAEATIEVCQRNIKAAKEELLNRRQEEIQKLLKKKKDPFGDVTVIVGNHEVKINVPKKVTWDEAQLAAKYKEIIDSGESANIYIKTKHSISETAFKGFDKDVQEYFLPARTVTPGNPSLKILGTRK